MSYSKQLDTNFYLCNKNPTSSLPTEDRSKIILTFTNQSISQSINELFISSQKRKNIKFMQYNNYVNK